ncbi:MAG: hypothetical protein P9L99_11320 [Candidatus Lernaella stagnicola]|nr:hypothetical protein [Candidatus Lernaella stagnicola]
MSERSFTVIAGVIYSVNPVHRNSTRGKSQWTIDENAEISCFQGVHNKNWIVGKKGWGLHLVNGKVTYLGLCNKHDKKVFVAKFVMSNAGVIVWHGYPADHRNNAHDIPDLQIINQWISSQLIPLPKIRKIIKGQPCSL